MRGSQGYRLLVRLRLPKRWILRRDKSSSALTSGPAAPEQSATPAVEAESASQPHCAHRLSPRLLNKRATLTATVLFLLMLSGPPRLRIRDPEASLHGDIDWVVVFNIVVWGSAGLWILAQFARRLHAKRPLLRLRLPQILGLGMICCLAVSITVSDAPALTAFKVFQMLVTMQFTQLFLERFGIRSTLRLLLRGNTLLCVAIAACALLAPNMVWGPTELNPYPSRLYGDLIAQTGVVSVLAMILLLTGIRRTWKTVTLSSLALFLSLLVLSLMRTAYITAFVFLTLVLLTRPNIKPLRRFAYFLLACLLMLYSVGRFPSLSQYRDPQTISNLGDRIGLWRYLTDLTLRQSPWFGLGYYSASRLHGPEYNAWLGTAHSMFFEVLLGGGLVSFALLLALCVVLSIYAVRLLSLRADRFSFATAALFTACLLFGFTEETIDSGPVAICFWCSAAILPMIYKWASNQNLVVRGAAVHATS